MIVYLDLVCLLNIFLDFILLMSVSVVLTRNAKIKRIILGSMIGGVSTLILFVHLNSFTSLIFKIILGIIMVITTFGYKNLKYTLNNLFYLYTLSFSIGGVMYLFMNKMIYNYVILIIGFFIVSILYIKQIKKFQNNYSEYYEVEIIYQNEHFKLTGYLDTGNKLYDMYKHRPVILVDKKIKYHDEDVIYVPYLSLNEEKILKCLKADKVIINQHVFKNYLIGLSKKKFKIDGIDCILHSKMKGDLHA